MTLGRKKSPSVKSILWPGILLVSSIAYEHRLSITLSLLLRIVVIRNLFKLISYVHLIFLFSHELSAKGESCYSLCKRFLFYRFCSVESVKMLTRPSVVLSVNCSPCIESARRQLHSTQTKGTELQLWNVLRGEMEGFNI